jgi:1-deoxyxylulose-5-phosphate synthase
MRYRQLGSSDLEVSEICLGSWLTFGVGIDRDRAQACVDRAFDVGINFIDTANVYGKGAAEEFLGEALADRPRDSYILATKLYFPMTDQDRGLSRAQVEKQIDASLKRLRVEYVDLYQCHRYDVDTPLEETMEALTEVVRSGKARYIGFSEWKADQIQAALDLPGVEKFVSSQPQYSMLARNPEAEVIPLCAANGISQIVFSPLGQGVLTGKYRPGEAPPADSRAMSDDMNWAMGRFLTEEVIGAVDRLRPVAEGLGITMSQMALAWVLREPNVASAIVGASRPEQVDDNAGASGIELDEATLAAIDEALGSAATAANIS